MRYCTLAADATVGRSKFKAGETVRLPEAFVRALTRRGLVVIPPAPVAVPPEPPPPDGTGDSTAAVEERVTKPAALLSKRALRKLFKRKA